MLRFMELMFLTDYSYETALKEDTSDKKYLIPGGFFSYKLGDLAFGLGFCIPVGGIGCRI